MPLRPSPQGVQEASRSPHQGVAISTHRTTRLLQALGGLSGHNIEHTQKKGGYGRDAPCQGKCNDIRGYLVSAAGFEPATHALKGHCSTN
jgi:hypothetical protein